MGKVWGDLKLLIDGLECLGVFEVEGNMLRLSESFRKDLAKQIMSVSLNHSLTLDKLLVLAVARAIIARGGVMDMDSLAKYVFLTLLVMKKTHRGLVSSLIDAFYGGLRK